MLEDRQPRHQPRRQRRAARLLRIDPSPLLLEGAPLDRPRELRPWMMKVDDLVEPRSEQIALAGVPTLLRPHQSPRRRPQSSQGITARRPDQFARKPVHNGRNPANTITSRKQKLTAGQRLGSSSRTTTASRSVDMTGACRTIPALYNVLADQRSSCRTGTLNTS